MKTIVQPVPVDKGTPPPGCGGARAQFRLDHSTVGLFGWLPLPLLPMLIWPFRALIPAWAFMWVIACGIFFGCKWLTYWQCQAIALQPWRNWAYLFAWPGLDAAGFLHDPAPAQKPSPASWAAATLKTLFGAALIWLVARRLPATSLLLVGWCGMLGLIFLLHFVVVYGMTALR